VARLLKRQLWREKLTSRKQTTILAEGGRGLVKKDWAKKFNAAARRDSDQKKRCLAKSLQKNQWDDVLRVKKVEHHNS